MFSISTDLIDSDRSGLENELSSFQFECSQIVQNVCSEATSAFSIFSLIGAGWIGQVAKLSCLSFVSRFSSSQTLRQSSSFLFSAAVEGGFFHGCSAFKQGISSPLDFARGSAHSGIVLAGCKLTGGIAPQSFVLTQLFQCFAIVQINEVCGGVLIDQEIGNFEEKMVRAAGTSIPMLISGQLLASSSPGHLIRQAKYNLKIEMQNKGPNPHLNSLLFCPERVTPEGFRFRNEIAENEKVKRSNIFQMAGKESNGSTRPIFEQLIEKTMGGSEVEIREIVESGKKKPASSDEEACLAFRFQCYRRKIETRGDTTSDDVLPVVDWLSPASVHEVSDRLSVKRVVQEGFDVATQKNCRCLSIRFLGNATEDFLFVEALLRDSPCIEQVRIDYSNGSVRWWIKGLERDPYTLFKGRAPTTVGEDLRTFFEYKTEEVHHFCIITPFKDSNSLGNYLVRMREKGGFESPFDLCKAANELALAYEADSLILHPTYLSDCETGKVIPPENLLRWISRICRMDEEIPLYFRRLQIKLRERTCQIEDHESNVDSQEKLRSEQLARLPPYVYDRETALILKRVEKIIEAYSKGEREELLIVCPPDLLRRIKQACGFSTVDVAEIIKATDLEQFSRFSDKMLRQYEKGDFPPDILLLGFLSEIYRVPLNVLLYAHFQQLFPNLHPRHWIFPNIPISLTSSLQRKAVPLLLSSGRKEKSLTRPQVMRHLCQAGVAWSENVGSLQKIEEGRMRGELPIVSILSDLYDQDREGLVYNFFADHYSEIDPLSLSIRKVKGYHLVVKKSESRLFTPRRISSLPDLLGSLREQEKISVEGAAVYPLGREYGIGSDQTKTFDYLRGHEKLEGRRRKPDHRFMHFYGRIYGVDGRDLMAIEPLSLELGNEFYPLYDGDPRRENTLWFYQAYDPEKRSLAYKLFLYRHRLFRVISVEELERRSRINVRTLKCIEDCRYPHHILMNGVVEKLAVILEETSDEIRKAYTFQDKYLNPIKLSETDQG